MESVLKFLDDLDDLQAFVHVHRRPVIVTLLLLVVGAVLVVGLVALGTP